jgi:hypothetical protein
MIMSAFLDRALGNDGTRPELSYYGSDGTRDCTTDGHRAHIEPLTKPLPKHDWEINVRPGDKTPGREMEGRGFPPIDGVIDYLTKEVIKLALDEDQRRALRLLCAASEGVTRLHVTEWKKLKKKKRGDAPPSASILITVDEFGTWVGLDYGAQPGIINGAGEHFRTVKAWPLGVGAEKPGAICLDASYLADVLDTLPIAGESTHIEQPYKVVKPPADLLVIEFAHDGYSAARLYAARAPETFALIMPRKIK